MPEICRFHGIVVRMYPGDHAPPHFHALHGDDEVLMDIDGLAVLRGRLPPHARKLVTEWAALRQAELREAWERAQRLEPPGRIAPPP